MAFFGLVGRYLLWHYSQAYLDLVGLYRNFTAYLWRFFSISSIGRTLFSPWRRLGESYHQGFDPQAMLDTLIVNTLMRIVGFIIRVFLLGFWLFCFFLLTLVSLIVIVGWALVPLLWCVSLVGGILLILGI